MNKDYLKSILDEVKSIAIVGASSNPERDRYKVMKFLQDYGFQVFPVNPNLINTNLEAISSSCCMIIPSPQTKRFIDIKTYQLLKENVLYYKVNSVEDLSKKILYLLNYPDNIEKFKNKISNIKTNFIRTWKDRMDEEFLILKLLQQNKYNKHNPSSRLEL